MLDRNKDDPGVDWQAYIFDVQAGWIERLMAVAARRFPDRTLAEEAYNFAFERISEHQWARLDKYTGKSSPSTFLIAVFKNQLEDFARSKFGRARPPAWLSRLGQTWTMVYRLLCLERNDPQTVVEVLTARGQRAPQQVRDMIKIVYQRITQCGKEIATYHNEEVVVEEASIERKLEKFEIEQLLGVLRVLMHEQLTEQARSSAARAVSLAEDGQWVNTIDQQWEQLRLALQLSADERLILREVFQQNRKVTEVARALNLPEHQVRRQCKRAVARLRDVLVAAGISSEVLQDSEG